MIVYMDGILKAVENWGHLQMGQKKREDICTHLQITFLKTQYYQRCIKEYATKSNTKLQMKRET